MNSGNATGVVNLNNSLDNYFTSKHRYLLEQAVRGRPAAHVQESAVLEQAGAGAGEGEGRWGRGGGRRDQTRAGEGGVLEQKDTSKGGTVSGKLDTTAGLVSHNPV